MSAHTTGIFHKLKRPYAMESSVTRRWQACFFFGLFVFGFLLIFQPFGLATLPQGIWQVSLGYGFTTFLIMVLLNVVVFTLLPQYFNEQKWTVGRELFWACVNISLIGLANAAYTAYIGLGAFSLYNVLWYQVYTFVIGLFPVMATVLLREAALKRKYEAAAAVLNTEIHQHEAVATYTPREDVRVLLASETANDNLELSLSDLCYIRSSDNYVEVYYQTKHGPAKKLLRNTLKQIAEDLSGYPNLFRCHKSYLVNLDNVKHVSGNAQGYKLHLSAMEDLVPVSRQLNEEIKRRLADAP